MAPGRLRCVFFQREAADWIRETNWVQKRRAHRQQLLPATQDREGEPREAAPSISAAAYRAEQPEAARCCKHTQKQVSVIQTSLCWSCCRAKPKQRWMKKCWWSLLQFKDLILMVWVMPPDISSSPTLRTVVPLVPEKYWDLTSRLGLHYKPDKSGISSQSLICFCWAPCG